MKHAQATSNKKILAKGIGTATLIAGLGFGILAPGASLAAFQDTAAVTAAVVDTGTVSVDKSSINLESSSWTLNEAPISGAALQSVALKPGDSLKLTIRSAPHVREGKVGSLQLTGYTEVEALVESDPLISMNVKHEGIFRDSGSSIVALNGNVRQNSERSIVVTEVGINMEALSSDAYDSLDPDYHQILDLSHMGLRLIHN